MSQNHINQGLNAFRPAVNRAVSLMENEKTLKRLIKCDLLRLTTNIFWSNFFHWPFVEGTFIQIVFYAIEIVSKQRHSYKQKNSSVIIAKTINYETKFQVYRRHCLWIFYSYHGVVLCIVIYIFIRVYINYIYKYIYIIYIDSFIIITSIIL